MSTTLRSRFKSRVDVNQGLSSVAAAHFLGGIARALCTICLTVAIPKGVRADEPKPLSHPQTQALRKVDFEQKLGAQLPLDRQFVDEAGRQVRLGSYFRERPVLFVLAYFRCPMLCNQVLNGVLTSTNGLNLVAGRDFEIVVVSFDPTDSPSAARAKRETYTRRYHHRQGREGWHFLTGKSDDIAAVAQACGFRFFYDEPTDQFAHASGIMVTTADGQLSQYFYGIDYPTRDLRLALVESSQGRIGNLVDKVLLRCFHYDAITGRYGLAVMRLVQAGGVLTIVLVGGFIVRSLRKERRLAGSQAARSAAGTPRLPLPIPNPEP